MAKILIIEDDLALLDTYESILKSQSHDVVKCNDGMDALRRLEKEKYDLIITDLKLPKLSGQKLIEILQQKTSTLPFHVVISSGFIDKEIIDSFAHNKRIHFLPKPVSIFEMTKKIKQLLNTVDLKSKLDVRFLNPVLSGATETISLMTGLKVVAKKPYIKKQNETSGDISGVVGVVGSGFKGTISLSFAESSFLVIVSKMLNEECKAIDDENKDAVAELLNIIFGTAKRILNEEGLNIQSAIPTIIRGKNHSVTHRIENKTIVIPFSCNETEDFRIEISTME